MIYEVFDAITVDVMESAIFDNDSVSNWVKLAIGTKYVRLMTVRLYLDTSQELVLKSRITIVIVDS